MDRSKVVLGLIGAGAVLCVLILILCAVGMAIAVKNDKHSTPDTFQLCLDMGGKRTKVLTQDGMVDGCLVEIP